MSEPYLKKSLWLPALLLIGTMLLFLIFPAVSFEGAKSGLLLWFHQVLPSLLPFLILTNLLISLGLHKTVGKLLYPFFHPLFGCSESGCFALIAGLLSGLPVGAKVISDLYDKKELQKKEGVLLLALCCNPSPMFLISYACVAELGFIQKPYLILFFVLGSALLSHFCLRLLLFVLSHTKKYHTALSSKAPNKAPTQDYPDFSFSLMDSCLMNSFETTTKVGGYIILFSIYASLLPRLLPLTSSAAGLLPLCLLEITTGIHAVCSKVSSQGILLFLVVASCCFGGLSGLVQTKSVLSSHLLPFRFFFLLKLWQGLLGVLLTAIYLF